MVWGMEGKCRYPYWMCQIWITRAWLALGLPTDLVWHSVLWLHLPSLFRCQDKSYSLNFCLELKSLSPICHHWFLAFLQLSPFFFILKKGARCEQFSSVSERNRIRRGCSFIFHLPRHSYASVLKWELQHSNACVGRCCTNGSRCQFSLSPIIAAQLTPLLSRFYCWITRPYSGVSFSVLGSGKLDANCIL